jgi:hypothetical protein
MKINVSVGVLVGLACLVSVAAENRSGQRETSQQASHRYLATVWTTENGLPQNSVNAIVQPRDGDLWLAAFGG